MYVDGETFSSIFGTGTEDDFGYAWCKPQRFNTPFVSQPRGEGNEKVGYSNNNRYHLLDDIPFTRSVQFNMEIWHSRRGNMNYAAATFFYARPGSSHNIEPDVDAVRHKVALHIDDVIAENNCEPCTASGATPLTFNEDVEFLKKHTDVVVLRDGERQVAVVPQYQGRVMTSTASAESSSSYGWLNYELIEKGVMPETETQGTLEDHIYVFGGEERFWMGPEGGQFSIFFKPGVEFDFANWETPASIDTLPYNIADQTGDHVASTHDCVLTNYSGTELSVGIKRTIRLLGETEVTELLKQPLPADVQYVAYESDNVLINRGDTPWTKETGLLSIWILGMYKPSPGTTAVIPVKTGPEETLGPVVDDAYFGRIPPEYLAVSDDAVFLKGDGTRRGKIGISPARSKGIAGSYDASGNTLTLVTYNVPDGHAGYVNSMWEIQKKPFDGDAINAYNDGSPGPGLDPLGPFYELETSSPATALNPGESIRHIQRTLHTTGPEKELDEIAKKTLGVGIDRIKGAFQKTVARQESESAAKPNIVFILADDLGYGDVQCLNPERGKIKTPNLDELASQGMVFSDAHSTSSVCTPSRYSVLTGRYNWRSRLQQKVLGSRGNSDHSPLIAEDRLTVGELLQQQGYVMGCVGKWHLGLNWAKDANGEIDYSQPFTGGPTERGFDSYAGNIGAGAPPHGFIENDRVVGELSTTIPSEMLRWGGNSGPMVPGFTLKSILPVNTDKAREFIEKHAAGDKPFFLYYALSAPHLPVVPNKEWIGSSGLGQYADFVQELDFEVGRVIDTIDRAGIGENTLVIFTSDNGCTPMVGTLSALDPESEFSRETVPGQEELFGDKRFTKRFTTGRVLELNAKGHYPSADMRGYKSDTWDGGHRVLFIVRWPAKVKAGTKSDQLVRLVDFMATCADIHDVTLPPDAGEDSVSLLPVFQDPDQSVRDSLVHHSFLGKFAIREGKWKLMLGPGSGGWWPPKDDQAREQGLPPVQLYDMSQDVGEQQNLQAQHPEVVERLTKLLEKFVADGRSTPGPKQANAVPVDIWKKQD